jgi:tetratricopeptide (TPR) repeat protein
MMALVDRALALNPSFARGWYISGVLRMWAGLSDIAIEHTKVAMRLNPRGLRIGASHLVLGAAYFQSRRFDEALSNLLLAIQEEPNYPMPYRYLAACYAHMGQSEDSRRVVTRLRAITPVVVPSISALRKVEHRELFFSGLRLAAGEERGRSRAVEWVPLSPARRRRTKHG